MLKNEKIKKLRIRHHKNKIFYRSVYFCLMPVQVGTHIVSYVISHSFYKKILKICQNPNYSAYYLTKIHQKQRFL